MKRLIRLVLAALTLALAACTSGMRHAAPAGCRPSIYPDYTGVTIPTGIAPLDFALPGADRLEVRMTAPDGTVLQNRGKSFTKLPIRKWKALLERSVGDSLRVEVAGRIDGTWKSFDSFGIFVSPDPIDYGLNYRLIAPGYEIYSHMGIYERELGSFQERGLLENTQFDGCVNCHAYNRGNPDAFSLHIRGDHGATFRLLHQQYPPGLPCSAGQDHRSVRPGLGPAGVRCGEQPDYHGAPDQAKGHLGELPGLSPDGRTLYFTAAREVQIPGELPQSQYNLLKVSFDPETGTIGQDVQTVVDAVSMGKSLTFPKPSYDGKYLMFTLCDYGTFSIWHHESDLWLLDLETGEIRPLDEVNSPDTDSYHNWSSNSRWFVFSSRRDDGSYTRPYISHFDENGVAGKPFMLPQRDPVGYYRKLYRSYNVPEFVTGPVPLDRIRAQKLIDAPERVPFGFRWSD